MGGHKHEATVPICRCAQHRRARHKYLLPTSPRHWQGVSARIALHFPWGSGSSIHFPLLTGVMTCFGAAERHLWQRSPCSWFPPSRLHLRGLRGNCGGVQLQSQVGHPHTDLSHSHLTGSVAALGCSRTSRELQEGNSRVPSRGTTSPSGTGVLHLHQSSPRGPATPLLDWWSLEQQLRALRPQTDWGVCRVSPAPAHRHCHKRQRLTAKESVAL